MTTWQRASGPCSAQRGRQFGACGDGLDPQLVLARGLPNELTPLGRDRVGFDGFPAGCFCEYRDMIVVPGIE